jgi:uncharacterized protein
MSLAFPDVNVWLALSIEHVHQDAALEWWNQHSGAIGFCRFTQLGLLRLLTTSSVMAAKPLTMLEAWKTYDRFLSDERVEFVVESPAIDPVFRTFSSRGTASPKLWADAYLLAFAAEAGGVLVTFDRVVAGRAERVVLLA